MVCALVSSTQFYFYVCSNHFVASRAFYQLLFLHRRHLWSFRLAGRINWGKCKAEFMREKSDELSEKVWTNQGATLQCSWNTNQSIEVSKFRWLFLDLKMLNVVQFSFRIRNLVVEINSGIIFCLLLPNVLFIALTLYTIENVCDLFIRKHFWDILSNFQFECIFYRRPLIWLHSYSSWFVAVVLWFGHFSSAISLMLQWTEWRVSEKLHTILIGMIIQSSRSIWF